MSHAVAPLKGAVAGFGMAASCHAGEYRRIDGVDLVAAYSDHVEGDRAAILAACGPELRIFDDYERFIAESGADIVSVCTLPDRHSDHIVAAARAGKRVAAEKPICVTAAELEAIYEAVRAGPGFCRLGCWTESDQLGLPQQNAVTRSDEQERRGCSSTQASVIRIA
ncbi:MAG: Gfo/Idh/MocA family oxidoreductase [Roseiarcus sp.]